MRNATPPPGFGPPMPVYDPPPKKNRTNAYIIGGAAVAVAAIIGATFAIKSSSGETKATPTASATSATPTPSPDITDQFIDWRDNGGNETLTTLSDDLSAVDKASDPVNLEGLRDACATLTADVETAQQGDPIPDDATNKSWDLALEHLANSASACTLGAVGNDQASFDLMASEMDIGIRHLNAVGKHLDKVLKG